MSYNIQTQNGRKIIAGNGGGGGNANIWTGTQEEYNVAAANIADDTLVGIEESEDATFVDPDDFDLTNGVLSLKHKSSGGSILYITADPEKFAGQPVSAVLIQSSIPATEEAEGTFDNAGMCKLSVMNIGTYQVTSTDKDGNPATVKVSFDSFTAKTIELSSFSVKIWAQMRFPTFQGETIDDLTEKQIRELITVHATVDALVDGLSWDDELAYKILSNDLVAKWINLRDYALDTLWANATVKAIMDDIDKYGYGEWVLQPQVPKMTSNTAPLGECFGAALRNSDSAFFYPFTGSPVSNRPMASTIIDGFYCGYKFTTPVAIQSFSVVGNLGFDVESPHACRLQYSDDGFVWEDGSNTVFYSIDNGVTEQHFTSNKTNQKHLYWRLYSISNHGGVVTCINGLQFYAYAPKGNVPVMTSNNAPYGEAIAKSTYNGDYPQYKVFNGDEDTSKINWASNGGTSQWIGYKFVNPICVKKAMHLSQCQVDFTLQLEYSDDGLQWYPCSDKVPQVPFDRVYVYGTETEAHLYWRLNIESEVTTYHNTVEIQFYGRELKASVPTMSAPSSLGYTISSKSEYNADYGPWKAFDGSTSTWWSTGVNDVAKSNWIQVDFPRAICIKAVSYITRGLGGYGWNKYTLLGSNDNGDTWDTIGVVNMSNHPATPTLIYSNDNSYTTYRLLGEEGWTVNDDNCFATIQFYGIDYSEKEFDSSNNIKYIYDHGVELEELYLQSAAYTKVGSINIGDGQNCKPTLYIKNPIDFSPYNIMRATSGLNWYNNYASRQNMITLGMASIPYQWEGYRDCGALDLYYDVRNIMEEKSAFFGWGANAIINIDITEWWLE